MPGTNNVILCVFIYQYYYMIVVVVRVLLCLMSYNISDCYYLITVVRQLKHYEIMYSS